jgi:cytochrome bd ubiquinol oxidase subunit I
MELDPLILSRIQLAFVIRFHIIFPSFTIGLAAWLATIEGAHLFTRNEIYRRVFDFWLKIFAVSFGVWVSYRPRDDVPIRHQLERAGREGRLDPRSAARLRSPHRLYAGGHVLRYRAPRRNRVSPSFFFFACCIFALGTMFSSFISQCRGSLHGQVHPTEHV